LDFRFAITRFEARTLPALLAATAARVPDRVFLRFHAPGSAGAPPRRVTFGELRALVARGALVAQVTRGGPADKAGMKVGDVINKIQEKSIQDSVAAMAVIAGLKPGENAKFIVTRKQQDVELAVNVAKRPRPPRAPN